MARMGVREDTLAGRCTFGFADTSVYGTREAGAPYST